MRSRKPFLASAVACWWVKRKLSKSMAGKRTIPLPDESSNCGSELNVTDLRIVIVMCSADGQLARGITGGNTDSNNNGKPPPMLGVRGFDCFELAPIIGPISHSLTTANSCLIIGGIDRLDEDVDELFSSIFSNFVISASSAAISFLYTRFCTSTRYCNSRLSSVTNRRVLHSIFKPMLWITGSVITPFVWVECGYASFHCHVHVPSIRISQPKRDHSHRGNTGQRRERWRILWWRW